jgi:hypothetical protein
VSTDLQQRLEVLDDWAAYTRSDDRLASWAHGVIDEPAERDLGALADWAADTVPDPIFADDLGAEQALGTAKRARPTGESSAGAPLSDFAELPPAAKRARRDDPARQELAARAQLHPRTGLVAVSTIDPPVVDA